MSIELEIEDTELSEWQAFVAGKPEDGGLAERPAPAPEPEPAPPARAAASLPASRAMTVSIDFDRTFAADPALWGEFAEEAAEAGNTVVMVSRRPDTPENQQIVRETIGDYAEYFSQVLLVGEQMKDEAAKAAGVEVDVWVDDSPQFVRSEPEPECAKPKRKPRKRKADDGGEV